MPSLSQPSLANPTSAPAESLSPESSNVRVTRSVSDVLKAKGQQGQQPEQEQQQLASTSDNAKLISNRKTKEERRLSNRQKLLSLKRHSGYLKRPEILETVYSVEEDGDGAQQQQLQQQQHEYQQQSQAVEQEKSQKENTETECADKGRCLYDVRTKADVCKIQGWGVS